MKILIAPDSFKGTLTSLQAAELISKPFIERNHSVVLLPVADGGEGTVDAFIYSASAQKKVITVKDPLLRDIEAYYGFKGNDAFIEIAQPSGITLLKENELNPLIANTYGFGQMIMDACRSGYKNIYIGLGGSATNDAGIGMLSALGMKFFDKDEKLLSEFLSASDLDDICTFDDSQLKKNISGAVFTVLCDVKNYLTGPDGASFVYSFQKGADHDMAKKLDASIKRFAEVLREKTGKEPDFPGAGAAGGTASVLKVFFDAEIIPGIEGIIKILNLEQKIQNCDVVIVGEGSLDNQSVFGKAPVGIAKLAKKYNKPVIAICGKIGKNTDEIFNHGIDFVYASYGDVKIDMNVIKKNTVLNITKVSTLAAEEISKLSIIKNRIIILNET